MDNFATTVNAVTFGSWLLALILDASQSLELHETVEREPDCDDHLSAIVETLNSPLIDTMTLMSSTLYNFRLCCAGCVYHDEVMWWIKPRSCTWFSRFLLEQYDNSRWISMFRMTKVSIFYLADLLKTQVEKKNTKYRLAVPVLVRVACTLFKLSHGANLTICSEMFAIGRSTVSKVLRQVVNAINETLIHEISWPSGQRMRETQAKFATLCSLPAVVGVIDGMHVSISKPAVGAADYFYFKSGGYTVNCQAVVDSEKRFLDLYIGMPGSTNDSRMLRRSSLHHLASHGSILDATYAVDGHSPYLIGDLGYPLLSWLMVLHRGQHDLSVSQALFNKKLWKGRCVIENAFGILKQTFRELLDKSDLALTFLPNVILSCAILHNLLLHQSHDDVENLLAVLRAEGLQPEIVDEPQVPPPLPVVGAPIAEEVITALGSEKRNELSVYLSTRRRHQV